MLYASNHQTRAERSYTYMANHISHKLPFHYTHGKVLSFKLHRKQYLFPFLERNAAFQKREKILFSVQLKAGVLVFLYVKANQSNDNRYNKNTENFNRSKAKPSSKFYILAGQRT